MGIYLLNGEIIFMTDKIIAFSREFSQDELAQALFELDIYGYTIIPGYFKQNIVSDLLLLVRDNYESLNSSGKIKYSGVPERDFDDQILYNVFNCDNKFLDILMTPMLRSIAMDKLNDRFYRYISPDLPNYNLLFYNARSSGSELDLHIDSYIPSTGSYFSNLQIIILLEKSNTHNGCTTVVPGSHKSGTYSNRELKKVTSLEGEPGDVIIFDSRLWHGTHKNTSKKSRWALVATLGMWWVKQTVDIPRIVRDEIYQNCSNEQKQFLGFCSLPSDDVFKRLSAKCGYESLKKSISDYNF
jgi:hypothetical protein